MIYKRFSQGSGDESSAIAFPNAGVIATGVNVEQPFAIVAIVRRGTTYQLTRVTIYIAGRTYRHRISTEMKKFARRKRATKDKKREREERRECARRYAVDKYAATRERAR